MDIKELIEQLNARGLSNGSSLGYHCGLFDEAATALSTLQAENNKLRAELEKVKAERDEAEKGISHLKLVMRERGIYTIPAIYPWEKPEWNMP